MMKIILNGEAFEAPEGISVADLIEQLGLADKRLALERNREIVPRSQYAEVALQPADEIEIVHAIGGG